MNPHQKIVDFLEGGPHAVAGASRDRSKYGNKVLRVYLETGRKVYPVNPNAEEVEGLPCYPSLAELPESVHGVSVVTPPEVTEDVVEEAARRGIRHVWMQPGAESPEAIERAERHGLSVIAGGPCILVALGFRGEP